jgi:hypothetical protein
MICCHRIKAGDRALPSISPRHSRRGREMTLPTDAVPTMGDSGFQAVRVCHSLLQEAFREDYSSPPALRRAS